MYVKDRSPSIGSETLPEWLDLAGPLRHLWGACDAPRKSSASLAPTRHRQASFDELHTKLKTLDAFIRDRTFLPDFSRLRERNRLAYDAKAQAQTEIKQTQGLGDEAQTQHLIKDYETLRYLFYAKATSIVNPNSRFIEQPINLNQHHDQQINAIYQKADDLHILSPEVRQGSGRFVSPTHQPPHSGTRTMNDVRQDRFHTQLRERQMLRGEVPPDPHP
jgi:hypothetical protein